MTNNCWSSRASKILPEKIQRDAKYVAFPLKAVAQISELTCAPCLSHVPQKKKKQDQARFQRLLRFPLGERVDHEEDRTRQKPATLSNLKKRLPHIAPTSASPQNNPCCRHCHDPTPDFHNSLCTSSCATRPTQDVIHVRTPPDSATPPQSIQDGVRGCQAPDSFIYTFTYKLFEVSASVQCHRLLQPCKLNLQVVADGAPPEA